MHMPETRKNPSRPIVGVGAVIFKDDKILLIKRGKEPKKNQWSLPGGAQNLGETAKEALAREVIEETGLRVKITSFIDVVDFIEWGDDKSTPLFQYTLLDYSADYVEGTLRASSDAIDAQFFTLSDILALPLWSETKRVIKQAALERGLY